MKRLVLGSLVSLALMEGVVWFLLKEPKSEPVEMEKVVEELKREEQSTEASRVGTPFEETVSEYPKITTEVKNGRTERTIHMGVRQWVWEPSVLRAKEGELVRLVIHNADVRHPLYIPELGIEAEVPPEGAVVEFEAKRKGEFFFLCGTYCGEGHAEMQGTLIID